MKINGLNCIYIRIHCVLIVIYPFSLIIKGGKSHVIDYNSSASVYESVIY